MRTLLMICLAVFAFACVEGKVFSECDMVKELMKHGVHKKDMAKWMCLIKSESNFDTMATQKNDDGSMSYGLFQINNKKYCTEGTTPGNFCHVTCKDLLSDDITASMKCAMMMKHKMGFKTWTGYKTMCEGHKMEDYSHCYA